MLRRMLNPLFPRFSIPSFLLPFFLFFSNRPPYLSEGTESSSKLHADHRARFDFNGCHHEYHLEMLIPIIRPTIVSGKGLDWVQRTPIPLIRYVSDESFEQTGGGGCFVQSRGLPFLIECRSANPHLRRSIHPSVCNIFHRFWLTCETFRTFFYLQLVFVENRCVQVS